MTHEQPLTIQYPACLHCDITQDLMIAYKGRHYCPYCFPKLFSNKLILQFIAYIMKYWHAPPGAENKEVYE